MRSNGSNQHSQESGNHRQLPQSLKAATLILGALMVAQKHGLATAVDDAPELSQYGWKLFQQLRAEKYRPTDQEWNDVLRAFVSEKHREIARRVLELVLSDAWTGT